MVGVSYTCQLSGIGDWVVTFISLVEFFYHAVHLLMKGIQTEDMMKGTATGQGWLRVGQQSVSYYIDLIAIIVHTILSVHEMAE
ncbi:hypothetical protein DD237_007312 [Peronospora effusa]|uniref:Uncharacterized protein n=1 Tax=Peronospora effusa TaxID=542832 RepID=A0A425BZT6_9STRA|nr:hypothetical protein DD237_007312 [Peronospora effusa]